MFSPHGEAAWYLTNWTGAAFWLVVLVSLSLSFRCSAAPPFDDEVGTIRRLLAQYGGTTLSHQATWRQSCRWVSSDRRVAIGYRVSAAVAIAVGDPIGDADSQLAAIDEFCRFSALHSWTPCLFSISEEFATIIGARGWSTIPVGEEAVVSLHELDFSGRQWQDVRSAINRARRSEVVLVTKLGNVFNFGGAPFYGSKARGRLPAPVTAFATTPDGKGYWLGLANGTVYPFGDAVSYSALSLNPRVRPLVAIVPSTDGKGYYLVTKLGNVYNYGDATWYGSKALGGLSAPVTAFAATADAKGYWLGLANGVVFNFGDATSFPSLYFNPRVRPLVAIVPSLDSNGYYLVTKIGNVYNYGDATWYGSPVHSARPAPIVSAMVPD